jgi:anti-sigma factor RsiW
MEGPDNNIHQVADHSFKASVETCSACHAEQMHAAGEASATHQSAPVVANPTEATEPTPAAELSSITPEPSPVSPLGYAGIAALVGLAAGMLLAPWLEKGYRAALRKSEEVRHDKK